MDLGERLAALPIAARTFADIVAGAAPISEKVALAQKMLDDLDAIQDTLDLMQWAQYAWSSRDLLRFVESQKGDE